MPSSPHNSILKRLILVVFILLPSVGAADEISPEELERWFQSDEFGPPRASGGPAGETLEFLTPAPDSGLHHHQNIFAIVPRSLSDGWVKLEQCHTNMESTARVEIVFRKGRVRDLKVTGSEKIGRAWVEGSSIQLEEVAAGARICLSAWTRALRINDDGSYTLYSGPYMRRFLDGYFPMHVSADISFAGTGLKFASMTPPAQPGFEVIREDERIRYDAWFRGRLVTEINFSPDIL